MNEFFVKIFEERCYMQYFLSHVNSGLQMSSQPKLKVEFLWKGEDGTYVDEAVQQAFCGFKMAINAMPQYLRDVMQERYEQISVHKNTVNLDVKNHKEFELISGATTYAYVYSDMLGDKATSVDTMWPFPKVAFKGEPGDYRTLVKAGAMFAAEADRKSFVDAGKDKVLS